MSIVKKIKFIPIILLSLFYLPLLTFANQELQTPQPLQKIIKQRAKTVTSGNLQVPLITWGGDVATIYTSDSGIFKSHNLDVSVFVENTFPKQVEKCLAGETPFIRGTMGMINSAAEVFKKNNLDLVVIYQLTWSTGGDALVARSSVKRPRDLRNKTVALQLYGPHMDYLANILNSANIPINKVKLKWFSELTLPSFDTRGKILDPVNAFLKDTSIDATMCIIPDALNLTSGGKVGTGAAGSVKGAKIILSTKTASRVISDVYAVRSDYLQANRSTVEKFVKALFVGQQKFESLKANQSKSKEYQKLLSHAAKLLLGTPQAVSDVKGLLGDCYFVGFKGNKQFFTGQGTTRTMRQLTKEIQNSFIQYGLMTKRVNLKSANWNYGSLGTGLKQKAVVSKKRTKRFDTRKVEQKISVESTQWAEEGTLFQIEINFAPNQSEFSQEQYKADFEKALSIAQTYAGSLIIIEGHSDPLGILKAKKKRRSKVEIRQMQQQAKNLSLSRARKVRQSFLTYCARRGLKIDDSQFVAVGRGVAQPKYNPPRTKDEWAANRRVLFRIKQIESELSEFSPL